MHFISCRNKYVHIFNVALQFKRWLDKRDELLGDRGAYDCVVDVANVAYYHSNGLNSKLQFNYSSVQCLVEHLEARNKRCLLILHESHLGPKDCRTAQDRSILRNWKAKNMVYFVPRGYVTSDGFHPCPELIPGFLAFLTIISGYTLHLSAAVEH